VTITYEWRGAFENDEVNRLHAEAFETEVFGDDEWNWRALTSAHSLGWVTAREANALVGFVNVLWDGLVHAWIQDTMVAAGARRLGVGATLVAHARMPPATPAVNGCTSTSTTTCASSTSTRAALPRRARG
jgi:hypothetical protein